ncbi:MAG TPA: cell division protein ZapE, partial [Trueperaceae bacterium]|nr:cell division protein ZapE [Trueperaceae bacterium]
NLPAVPQLIGPSDLTPPPPPDPARLVPPPRFATVSFANYQPQHPSQSEARTRLQEFIDARHAGGRVGADGGGATGGQVAKRAWSRLTRLARGEPSRRRQGAGIYLDGGFGVGKTHLLASAFSEADTPSKRYLTFQELVYLIGTMGRSEAEKRLASAELICIDEFELDDPGNTLIVKAFLAALFEAGGTVVTTSNTPPEAQGQGRFNADDFRREIQSVAERFEVVTIGGPDYRQRVSLGAWLDPDEMSRLQRLGSGPAPRLKVSFDELLALLASVHPSRYGGLVAQLGTVYLHGARTILSQNEALRFVHFIDKLYDGAVALRATGDVSLSELFDPSYRYSAYHKKHERCLSRLGELLAEAHDEGDPGADQHDDETLAGSVAPLAQPAG